MTFVDTSAWAALLVPADPHHAAARTWHEQNHDKLLTSDYIVDELLTLLKTRYSTQAAIRAGQWFWSERPGLNCPSIFPASAAAQSSARGRR